MSVSHHLSDEMIGAYAAGSLSEGWSLAVATHLALCPECRKRVLAAEAVGGSLLETADSAAMAIDSLEQVFARIDRAKPAQARSQPSPSAAGSIYPEPLRSYLGTGAIKWSSLGPSARQFIIKTADKSTSVRLLKVAAGKAMPVHGHRGSEITLVLQGSFSDAHGTFGRGDLEEADEEIEHQPVAAQGEDCICLAVTDAKLRLRGIAALLQPFFRI